MILGIIGSKSLNDKEKNSAEFILDSVLCRYATGITYLLTGNRTGIELLAEELAKHWKYPRMERESVNTWFNVHHDLNIDYMITSASDMLVIIDRKNEEAFTHIIPVAKTLNKIVIEIYI